MLGAIDRSWTPSRWAVIKDARRRQRRRRRRILAVAAVLPLATVGWAIARDAGSAHAPAAPASIVGTVEQLALAGALQDTTTLDGHLWVLTCLSHCSEPFGTASAGQLIELTATGEPIKRFPVSDPTVLTSGAGALWVAHFETGDVSRINAQTGKVTATTHVQLAKPIATNGYRRFEPAAISFGAGRISASDGLGFVAEINPRTARLERIVFTSSEATSSTSAAGLTWVADELDGVGTFTAGSDHVVVHHISWAGQPVDVGTVAYGAGLIWALGEETNYLTSLTHPTNVGVVTALDPHTGRIVHQWPISPPTSRRRDGGVWSASGLVLGNGSAYIGDDNNGRLLRLTPPHSFQILRGPKEAQLTAVTPHALWAINTNGHLLRINLARH
jgi:outer membrane protein assembly factor BamB